MALPKSGRSGSNVLKFDSVRRKRAPSTNVVKQKSSSQCDQSESKGAEGTLHAVNEGFAVTASGKKPVKKIVSSTQPDIANEDTAALEKKTSDKKTDVKAKPPRISNRRFNKVKVDHIKSLIARGEYRINFLQVADKFIEHERYS